MARCTDCAHWSLWQVNDYLGGISRPPDAYDPARSWKAVWWLVDANNTNGALTVTCAPGEEGVRLHLEHEVETMFGWGVTTEASLDCAADDLLSVRSWTASHTSFDGTRADVAGTQGSHEARVASGKLRVRGVDETSSAIPADLPVVVSWALPAVLPRLHAAGRTGVELTLVDELMVPRPRARLDRAAEIVVRLWTGQARLTGYRLMGRGLMPTFYWVTDTGWLMAVGGVKRAMILGDTPL